MGSRSTGTPFTAGGNSKSGGSISAVPSLPGGHGSRSTGNPRTSSGGNSKDSGGSTGPIDGSIRRGYVQESQSDLGRTQDVTVNPGGGRRVTKLSPPDGSPR